MNHTILEMESACTWALSTRPDECHHGHLTMVYDSRIAKEISFNYSDEISFSLTRDAVRVGRLMTRPHTSGFVGVHVNDSQIVFSLRGKPYSLIRLDIVDVEKFLSMTMEIVALGSEPDIDWEAERQYL